MEEITNNLDIRNPYRIEEIAILDYFNGDGDKIGEFIINAADLKLIASHKWYSSGRYISCKVGNKHIKLHRLIAGITEEQIEQGYIVDHINGDKNDNRRSNLRICKQLENTWNRINKSTNKSGIKGVYKSGRKWHSDISVNGKQITVLSTDIFENAVYARQISEEIVYKDYVCNKTKFVNDSITEDIHYLTKKAIRNTVNAKINGTFDKSKCSVCGRISERPKFAQGLYVCSKHAHQFKKNGYFLDDNPRNRRDLNKYTIYDNFAVFETYDEKGDIKAYFKIDSEDVDKIKNYLWFESDGRIYNSKIGNLSKFLLHIPKNIKNRITFKNKNSLDLRKCNLNFAGV